MFKEENCEFFETTNENIEVYDRCLFIRQTVFQGEQNIPLDISFEYEDECVHYLMKVDGKEAGQGRFRLMEDGYKFERIAILKDFRGQGVGTLLIKHMLNSILKHREARNGNEKIVAHAQSQALKFWQNLGFVEHGEHFDEGGVDHCHIVYNE